MNLRSEVIHAPPYSFHPPAEGIKLDQNELPYPLPDHVRDEVARVASEVALNRYPDLHAWTLRDRLARIDGWDPDGVLVTSGSNVLLHYAVVAAGIGRTVLTVSPTFSVYSLQARILGAKLVEVPLDAGFALPVDALVRELEAGEGVLMIANPAAPTGNLHPEGELERLIQAAAGRWLVVLDEAYHAFSGTDLSRFARLPNVLVVRTLSKAAGLAGLRVGYGLCEPQLARQLTKVMIPFNVSQLQQAIAGVILDHRDALAQQVNEVVSERVRMAGVMAGLMGVEVFDSSTNFLLFRVNEAALVYGALRERGILIRRQDHLPGLEGCLRVNAGLREENDAFLDALASVLGQGTEVPA